MYTMELKDVLRKERPKGERKTKRLNLRTDKEASKWMKDNNVSPQLVFDEAINELMKRK